jgi:hypothetical protein
MGAVLDTDPDVAHWAWYSGAYHQYHSMIWLLIEVYRKPDLPQAASIMSVADHCFGQSSAQTRQIRCAQILRAVRENMASFLLAIGSSDPQSTLVDRSVPDAFTTTEIPIGFQTPVDVDPSEFTLTESEIWWMYAQGHSSTESAGMMAV